MVVVRDDVDCVVVVVLAVVAAAVAWVVDVDFGSKTQLPCRHCPSVSDITHGAPSGRRGPA